MKKLRINDTSEMVVSYKLANDDNDAVYVHDLHTDETGDRAVRLLATL